MQYFTQNILRWAVVGLLWVTICPKTWAGGGNNLPDFSKMDVYSILDWAAVWSWKNLDTAFLINRQALDKAQQSGDREAIFYTLREQGIYFEQYNRPADALAAYQIALDVAQNMPNSATYLPIIFNDLAITSRKCGYFSESRNYHEMALRLALKTKNLELEEDSYNGLGLLLETLGNWDEAIEQYQKSVEVAQQRGNTTGVVISFQNIANALQKSGNEALALEKIEKAWQMASQTDSARQAHVLHDFGQILASVGRWNDAIAKFSASKNFYEKLGDRPMLGRSLAHLAAALVEKGDTATAMPLFRQAFSMENDIRTEDLLPLWLRFGALCSKNGQPHTALDALQKGLQLAQKFGYRENVAAFHTELANVFQQLGNFPKAFEHQKWAAMLTTEIEKAQRDRRSAELEFRFETRQKEKQIAELEHRQQMMMLGGVAAVSVLVAASFVFLFFQKNKHHRLLQQKNEEVQRANHQLTESNAVLQQFAYATAHDLKEPLRTIGSFVGLLEYKHGRSFPPEAIEYFEIVKTGTRHMNNLLSELLEYSTIFMDSPAKNVGTDVFRGLREVTTNLHEAIRRNGATLELPIEIPLPPVAMQKSHFVQLFQNLIGNAIKFSPENPRIKVHICRDDPQYYEFSVQDNGIGIDKNYGDKIFQIFQRLDKQRFEGAGIGLAICKNIVEKYGGSIRFESEIGKGTTFFVQLPVLQTVELEANVSN